MGMMSAQRDHSRTRIRARSRAWLAALVAGGLAAGGGFTLAAAHADTGSSAASQGPGGRHANRQVRPAPDRSEPGDDDLTPAPSRAPVRAPRQAGNSHRTAPPTPAGATHAS